MLTDPHVQRNTEASLVFAKLRQDLPILALSILLAAPAVWPYFTHYFVKRDNLVATGFIHPDMPSYMANAREYFDSGQFHFTYSNPASPSYNSPRIYFQLFLFLLAVILKVTGLDPGIVFMLVGFVAAVACVRVAIALYRKIIGLESWPKRFGLVLFCWGGGLLAFSGIAYKILTHNPESRVFRFDPAEGWWFLNFGRNLIFPTEAFYHALFLGCILCLVSHRYIAALVLAFLVSLSHPFTGIELIAILTAWTIVECYFIQNKAIPNYLFIGCVGLIAWHLGYYVVFLNSFPEHYTMFSEWSLPWLLQAENFIPAYALVSGLTVWRLRHSHLAHAVLRDPANRLFLIWFLVAFGLANHEFAIQPRQPLHFTRGYCWIPLFFLGAPVLIVAFERLFQFKFRFAGVMCCLLIGGVLLSDNLLWFGSFAKREDQGIRLTRDAADVIHWFNSPENRGFVVVSRDPEIGHMALVYSPLRAWVSHWETPERVQRQAEVDAFFDRGEIIDRWRSLPLLFVYQKIDPDIPLKVDDAVGSLVFQNSTYVVFRHPGSGQVDHNSRNFLIDNPLV
jgi:hypothetical protein